MVEQSCAGKAHCHTVLIAGFYNLIVSYASAGLCHVGNSASLAALDIIAEGEDRYYSGSDGVIRISARRENQMLILRVVDNGQGMSPEQIAALLQQERNTDKRRFSGIGLFNVYKRIQMRFGADYGLHITSQLGEYTAVQVTLPYVKERME